MATARRPRAAESAGKGAHVPPAGSARGSAAVSHNLNGQKLGRKGRDTRERILAATTELLADGDEVAVSLSAVARKASLGMTSIYNYFTDLTELLLAVLEPVMASGEDSYLAMLRRRWPDEELGTCCDRFLRAYYEFWRRHARLLHLRNAMADNRDDRMMMHRVRSSQPVIGLLTQQMDGVPGESDSPAGAMGTVLMTGIERTVTVATDRRLNELFDGSPRHREVHYIGAEARIMELAIRDTREKMAALRTGAGG